MFDDVSRYTLALACASLLGLGACSDDSGGTAPTSNDTGGADAYVPPDSGDEDSGQSGGNQVRDEYVVDDAPSCQPPASAPDRCSADPTSGQDWDSASVVTRLKLMPESKDAGIDLDGDGTRDNQLREILALLETQGGTDIDMSVAENIDTGDLLLVQEHQGIDDLQSTSSEYDINFFLGELRTDRTLRKNGTTKVHLSPASFASGTFPEARVGGATIEDGTLTAGPGKIALALNVPDLGNLSLTINGATLEAEVDQANSSLDSSQGIALTGGNIGGYVKIRDLFELLDDLLSDCDCLGNPPKALEIPEGQQGDPDLCANPDDCEIACKQAVEDSASQCPEEGDGLCQQMTISALCGALSFVKRATDLDLDGDGNTDVVSIGAKFDSGAASIEGIAPLVDVTPPTAGDSSVTASKVFAKTGSYVAVHEPGATEGELGTVLGSTRVSSGTSSDVSVSLGRQAEEGEKLRVVLYKDEDPKMSFDSSTDTATQFESARPMVEVTE